MDMGTVLFLGACIFASAAIACTAIYMYYKREITKIEHESKTEK